MEYGAHIFVGSDAHEPSRLGDVADAMALLEAMGFDEDLIVNNDEEKFKSWIHFKG